MTALGQGRVLDLKLGVSWCPLTPGSPTMGVMILGSPNTRTNSITSTYFTSVSVNIAGMPCSPIGVACTSSFVKKINNLGAYRMMDVTNDFFGISFLVTASPTSFSG